MLLTDLVGGETITNTEEELCFACHDGSPASTDIEATFSGTDTASSRSGALLNTRHDIYDADQTYSGAKIECLDCHDPHTVTSSLKNTADPDPTDGRVPAAGNTWAGSTLLTEFCLDCHDNSFPASVNPPTNAMTDIYQRWGGSGTKFDQHGPKDGGSVTLRSGSGYAQGDTLQCVDCHAAGHGDSSYPNLYQLKSIIYSKDGTTPLPPDTSIGGEDVNLVRITDVDSTDALTNGKAWCSTCHPSPMGGNKDKGCLSGSCHGHGTSSY